MAKVLVVGDPHFKVSALESASKLLSCLSALEESVDAVVITGDLNDTHAVLRSEVMRLWSQHLRGITKPYYLLVGNHDQAKAGSAVHGLEPFKGIPNVKVIDAPMVDTLGCFMPFVKRGDEFVQAIESFPAGGILWCHQTVQGAVFDNGFYSQDEDAVPLTALQRFDSVIAGHIHKRQKVGNVFYVGTPYHTSYNDVGEIKGLHIIDTETLDARFVPLKQFPTFHQVEGSVEFVQAQTKSLTALAPHDNLKIVLCDTKDSIAKYRKSADLAALRKRTNVVLIANTIDRQGGPRLEVKESLSPEAMLDDYVTRIMQTGLDRTRILSLARKYLRV